MEENLNEVRAHWLWQLKQTIGSLWGCDINLRNIMSLAHFIACTGSGETVSFEDGYTFFYNRIQEERIYYIYECGARNITFKDVLIKVA